MGDRQAYRRLRERTDQALAAGGEERTMRQHQGGRMTARERLDFLFDEGTFQELGRFVTHRCQDFDMARQQVPGDAVVTGSGLINGRLVHAYAQDFTVLGGTFSEANAEKIIRVLDRALELGTPFIGLNDSGGSRIQEGVCGLAGVAGLFLKNTLASGVIPQISAIMGPCAGGASYSPALTDFVLMVDRTSHMFVTGPEVIRAVCHEQVSKEELGGAATHNRQSGVAHFLTQDDRDCLLTIRELLSYLPQNNVEDPPGTEPRPAPGDGAGLDALIPEDPCQAYDVKALLDAVLDRDSFLEVQRHYAANLVVGFGRLGGRAVGIVANQPSVLAGALDSNASRKGARFVRFCDAFNLPLLTFVDVPGFLPGKQQELEGIIRDGAKLLYAYCEATVPKVCLITRKAYGGAYCVMSSKHIRGDHNFAYPGAEIAVMGAEGAVNILYRQELGQSGEAEALRRERIADYGERFATPYAAAGRGYIDEIIMPAETRAKLILALERLRSKAQKNPAKKHGNIPL